MLKKYLETGKIVGTHGVKGMLRVMGWCDSADFLKQFKYIYLDNEGKTSFEIKSVAAHGNIILMALKGVETIEEAERLRGRVIYIDRKKAKLPKGRYFIDELIGCTVFDADSNEALGTISDVSKTGANDVWHIKKDDKEYLVPAIDGVIISADVENEKAVIRPLKGIFDDED